LLALADSPAAIAGKVLVDAQYVYWSNLNYPHAIRRVPKIGGVAESLALDEGSWALAKDDSSLYWVQSWAGTVRKMTLDGTSPPIDLAQGQPFGQDDARGLAVDGSNVYWATYGGYGVWSVPIDGGLPIQLASAFAPSSIAVDATRIYWIETAPQAAVVAMPLAGGPKTILAVATYASNACSGGLVVAADNAYWANDTGYQVLRVPLSGGPSTVLAADQAQPCNLVIDDDNAYWTNSADGTVAKVPVTGGPVAELAALADSFPTGIAVDQHCIYWATNFTSDDSGVIWRVAK
jgi:sugar lactone lactonase YvrE